jgi:uncharacterized protein (TIGR00288 family)
MATPFSRAPHVESPAPRSAATHAPNAALLIDFDNVTMGMRSDLSKELRNLLNSDVIRGKVAVQRAYADWRRYPQYIVPLAENSVDLIFAPAYGSSKKNATDIRMAIDGMELIFTRPEIGTFILLTGDSDFSSLVLKLKEYGKYVIGVGIQESSSDLLVQNCDEYYSYTALTGLRRAGEEEPGRTTDPWVLVEKAVDQMIRRKDVMRSDRLKQVMLEIDPGFDEGGLGFSKFSRFLTEAAQKNVISLTKLDNGQYEVGPKGSSSEGRSSRKEDEPRRRDRGRDRDRDRERERDREKEADREEPRAEQEPSPVEPVVPAEVATGDSGLAAAYDLLRRAVAALAGDDPLAGVRDSDVKRKMLAFEGNFDEATLGFPKFSRFLRQAHDHEVVDLRKGENGTYEVALRGESAAPRKEAEKETGGEAQSSSPSSTEAPSREERPARGSRGERSSRTADAQEQPARRLQPRVSRGGMRPDGPPPLLEGQVVVVPESTPSTPVAAEAAAGAPAEESTPRGRSTRRKTAGTETAKAATARTPRAKSPRAAKKPKAVAVDESGAVNPALLGLPTDPEEVVRYLTTSYKGVGKKTAENLVEAFGDQLFTALNTRGREVRNTVPVARAEMVLDGWRQDLATRLAALPSADEPEAPAVEAEAAPEAPAPEKEQAEGEGEGARRRTRRTSRKGRGGRSGGSAD